jgi:hypothetical protein
LFHSLLGSFGAASNIAQLLNKGGYYRYSAGHVKRMNRKIRVRFEGSAIIYKLGHYHGWIFGDRYARHWTELLHGDNRRFQNPLPRELFECGSSHFSARRCFKGDRKFKSSMPVNVMKSGLASRFEPATIFRRG